MASYSGYVHNMKALDADQSWELLLRKALVDNTSTNGKCPEELRNIAEEILKQCGGLPLAISVVGGLLAKKTRCKSEWEKVLKEMKYHLDKSKDINSILAILELSYHNLPLELKACFLCLAFFKEDAIIEAKDLVHIWVAEGLVSQEAARDEETVEEVGREYLNELISRNLVQVKESEYDKVNACYMHDLLHDLSIRKAKEEIDFEILRVEGNSHQSLDKPRYRAIHCSKLSFVYSTNRNQYLRSLFIHTEKDCSEDGSVPSSYLKSFELLRVLDFGNAELGVLPKAMGVLTGLRYLKMKYGGHGMKRFPRSWSHLKNLKVLDLRGYGAFFIIDKVILRMVRLRHLYLLASHCEVTLGDLRNLQTLSLLRMSDSDLCKTYVMDVSKLGLIVNEITNASFLFTYLAMLKNLVCLTLQHRDKPLNMEGLASLQSITQLKLDYFTSMEILPRDFPPNLSHLTLSRLWLTEDPMPVLEKLPGLLYLKLFDAYGGEEMEVSRRGFGSLKILHLQYMNRLRSIKIEEGAMPELKQVLILDCPDLKIENLPQCLKSALVDGNDP